MSNLRERIEQELSALSQELGQFQTNIQYLNQSRELASSAVTSLHQITDLFQKLAVEFQETLSGHNTDLRDTEEEFSYNIRSSISQLSVVIEDLNRVKDQSRLPEKILQELSSLSEGLHNLYKLIAQLSEKQAEGFHLINQQNIDVQNLINDFKEHSSQQSKAYEQIVTDQFSQLAVTFQQLSSKSQNSLQVLEASLAQQHQKTVDEIDRLKDKSQILQEKSEMIITLLKSQEEKNTSGQNTIRIIGSIILLIELIHLGLLVVLKL